MPPKKKDKTAHDKPAKKRQQFTDPIMDGMRLIGRALDNATPKDRKFLLAWANERFGTEETSK